MHFLLFNNERRLLPQALDGEASIGDAPMLFLPENLSQPRHRQVEPREYDRPAGAEEAAIRH